MTSYQTTKIRKETLHALRQIYAATGESQISILDRLVKKELKVIKCKPVIYGDGVHNDTEGMQALVSGEKVYNPNGTEFAALAKQEEDKPPMPR